MPKGGRLFTPIVSRCVGKIAINKTGRRISIASMNHIAKPG